MKQTTKKRKSGRRAAASIKRKSNPTPDGELKNSTLQIENHERNKVFQKVVDYVNHQQYELPPSLVGFEFIQEPFCSCILTELKLCQRFWDTLNLCHADGSHIRLCTYKADELFISHIEVNEARRGLGIGTHMILFLLDLIEKACGSMIKVSLDVTRGGLDFVSQDQDDLSDLRIRFFRRFGFRLNLLLSRYPSYYLMELDQAKYELAKSKSFNSIRNSKLLRFDESTVSSLDDTVLGYARDTRKLVNLLQTYGIPRHKIRGIVAQKDNEMFYAIKATLIESAYQLSWFDEVSSVINQPAVNSVLSNQSERVLQFRNVLDFSFNNGCQLRFTSFGETIEITKIEVPGSKRRQGRGTKLIEMLIELGKMAGYDKLGLCVYLDENSEQDGLIEFFTSLGFELQVKGSNGSVMMVFNYQFESNDFDAKIEIVSR